MAITTAVCNSYKAEAHDGVHEAGDDYKIALYTSAATLSKSTTAYSATNEVVGAGYTAGGMMPSRHLKRPTSAEIPVQHATIALVGASARAFAGTMTASGEARADLIGAVAIAAACPLMATGRKNLTEAEVLGALLTEAA